MLKQLGLLASLQEVDARMDRCEALIREEPESLRRLREEVAEASSSLEEARRALKAAEVARMDKESLVKGVEEQISRLKGQQFEVKTNEAYRALLNELADLDVKKSDLETEVLLLLEEIDRLKLVVKEREAKQKAASASLEEARRAYEEEVVRRKEELSRLRARREEIASTISPEMLSTYERVRKARGGLAVVPIRNESCSGCFAKLRPQRMNELLLGNAIIRCEQCSRILYLPQDEER